jgi:hypothetical protein
LLRAGDDLSAEMKIDLSALATEPRFVPPPPEMAASPAQKPVNGSAVKAPQPVKKPAPSAAEKTLAERLKTALNQKGKGWLDRAFNEISRVQTGQGEMVFFLPEKAEYWQAILQATDNIEVISSLVKEFTGEALSITVKIEGRDISLKVPTTAELEKGREAAPEIWQAAQDDKAIKQVLNVFRGQIIDVRKTAAE